MGKRSFLAKCPKGIDQNILAKLVGAFASKGLQTNIIFSDKSVKKYFFDEDYLPSATIQNEFSVFEKENLEETMLLKVAHLRGNNISLEWAPCSDTTPIEMHGEFFKMLDCLLK